MCHDWWMRREMRRDMRRGEHFDEELRYLLDERELSRAADTGRRVRMGRGAD
jgi:hypothetical protein